MILPLPIVATALAAAPDPVTPEGADDPAFANRRNEAEQLIAANRLDEARAILDELETRRPNDSQVQFLQGLLDRQNKDYAGAAKRFRKILVSDPGAARVRLELALTFFQAGDYAGAERQLHFARAGHLPETVARNVDRYLAAVRQRKTFSYGFSLAVAPDSNLNAGPATDAVTLYGLPFQLSPDARSHSGVGLVVDASAEWAPRLARNLKLRLGGQVHRAQYGTSEFNDMTASFYAGPRLNLKRWEFNLTGTVGRRWYGERVYTDMVAGQADATYYLSRRVALGAAVGVNSIDYALNPQQSGMGESFAVNLSFVPTPATFLKATVLTGRQDAKVKAYANRTWLFGAQYARELKGGFTMGVAPSYTRIDYDEPLAAFGATRRDRQFTVQATLLNRRLDFHGLTPKLSYTYTHNDSTIELFTFSRSRFEIGITSAF